MSVDRQTAKMHENHANITRRVVSRPSLLVPVSDVTFAGSSRNPTKNFRDETMEAGLSVWIN